MDSEDALVLIVPVVLVGAISLAFWGIRLVFRRNLSNMRTFADRLGLTMIEYPPVLGLFPRSPTIEGVRRGKPIRLFTYSTGSGKSRKTWTAVGVQVRERSLSFSLQPQGLGTRILEFFGTREITIGDPGFDAAWFIRTNREDYLRIALIPELRERLMAARRAGLDREFRCENGEVRYAEVGGFAETDRLNRFLLAADLCGDLAEMAEVAGGAPPRRATSS